MIGFPGQALSAFSASARKPSVRAGLAKTWARVLAHVSGSASGSGLSTSFLARWSGIEALHGGDILSSRFSDSSQRRTNSPGRSIRTSRHSPRVNKFLCAPFRRSPHADDFKRVEFCSRSRGLVSESDAGTRLSLPSTDPGREVFQPNAAVGLCHGRASLPARRLHRPCLADRRSSRAPTPPCSSRPFLQFHVNVASSMTTRIAFMAYLSSLTGIRRRAFADARRALSGDGCESAWGPNADWRSNSLTRLGMVGSMFGAYSHLARGRQGRSLPRGDGSFDPAARRRLRARSHGHLGGLRRPPPRSARQPQSGRGGLCLGNAAPDGDRREALRRPHRLCAGGRLRPRRPGALGGRACDGADGGVRRDLPTALLRARLIEATIADRPRAKRIDDRFPPTDVRPREICAAHPLRSARSASPESRRSLAAPLSEGR